jgi:hypothetical protein
MTARQVGIILPLFLLFGVPRLATAQPAASRVTVRVYDTTGLTPELHAAALAVAGETLASASADVAWKPCDARTPGQHCDGPPGGDLLVRIVRSTAEQRGKQLPLGDAFVDTGSGAAVLATIYVDRVARVAHAAGMHTATLLGYAVAHELGHLLLASSTHSSKGLMRAMWREDELRSPHAADWRFTDQERAAIRGRLTAVASGYPENPIHRPPHPTVDHRAMDVMATILLRSGEK